MTEDVNMFIVILHIDCMGIKINNNNHSYAIT